jgi:hypothetical protein
MVETSLFGVSDRPAKGGGVEMYVPIGEEEPVAARSFGAYVDRMVLTWLTSSVLA